MAERALHSNERRLTKAEIAGLEANGWDFLPYGPNEWGWMKFDESGKRIASQCDATWNSDLREIERLSA